MCFIVHLCIVQPVHGPHPLCRRAASSFRIPHASPLASSNVEATLSSRLAQPMLVWLNVLITCLTAFLLRAFIACKSCKALDEIIMETLMQCVPKLKTNPLHVCSLMQPFRWMLREHLRLTQVHSHVGAFADAGVCDK
jgi:hypothetical protein